MNGLIQLTPGVARRPHARARRRPRARATRCQAEQKDDHPVPAPRSDAAPREQPGPHAPPALRPAAAPTAPQTPAQRARSAKWGRYYLSKNLDLMSTLTAASFLLACLAEVDPFPETFLDTGSLVPALCAAAAYILLPLALSMQEFAPTPSAIADLKMPRVVNIPVDAPVAFDSSEADESAQQPAEEAVARASADAGKPFAPDTDRAASNAEASSAGDQALPAAMRSPLAAVPSTAEDGFQRFVRAIEQRAATPHIIAHKAGRPWVGAAEGRGPGDVCQLITLLAGVNALSSRTAHGHLAQLAAATAATNRRLEASLAAMDEPDAPAEAVRKAPESRAEETVAALEALGISEPARAPRKVPESVRERARRAGEVPWPEVALPGDLAAPLHALSRAHPLRHAQAETARWGAELRQSARRALEQFERADVDYLAAVRLARKPQEPAPRSHVLAAWRHTSITHHRRHYPRFPYWIRVLLIGSQSVGATYGCYVLIAIWTGWLTDRVQETGWSDSVYLALGAEVSAPALVNTTTLLLVAAFTAIEVWLSGDEEAVAEDLSHPLSISRQATPAASDSVTLGMAGTAHHEGLRHVGERLERLQRAACAATIIGHRELRLALELASKAGSLDGLLSGLQGSAVLGIIVLTQSWPAGLLVDLLTEAAVMLCFDRIVARGGGLGPPFGMEPPSVGAEEQPSGQQ